MSVAINWFSDLRVLLGILSETLERVLISTHNVDTLPINVCRKILGIFRAHDCGDLIVRIKDVRKLIFPWNSRWQHFPRTWELKLSNDVDPIWARVLRRWESLDTSTSLMINLTLSASSMSWARMSATTPIIVQISRQANVSQLKPSIVLKVLILSGCLFDFWHMIIGAV